MKLICLIWLGWLMTLPAQAAAPSLPQAPLAAGNSQQGHLDYLAARLQQEQFAAMDSLLASLPLAQREYLLYRLLAGLRPVSAPDPRLLAWVRSQSARAPRWLVEGEVDGFLVQRPAYDFTAEARRVLALWQQQAWQDNYRQQLAQGSFEFKQLYYSRNPELARQQQALLAVLDQQPVDVLRREAQRLAALNIFLPDNRLLRYLVERTGDPALYQKLWRQPADHDSLGALDSVVRFHQGREASDLLIAASHNSGLTLPALHQLSRLSPLADPAQQYLLAELDKHQYSEVASLLLQTSEPRLLAKLADRFIHSAPSHATPVMLPNTGTPDASPGL